MTESTIKGDSGGGEIVIDISIDPPSWSIFDDAGYDRYDCRVQANGTMLNDSGYGRVIVGIGYASTSADAETTPFTGRIQQIAEGRALKSLYDRAKAARKHQAT